MPSSVALRGDGNVPEVSKLVCPRRCDPGQSVGAEDGARSPCEISRGGNAALGTYRDKHHPAAVGDTFQSLLSRSKALPVYLPDLDRYLLDYPKASSEKIQSEFYWEKVNFGLKPTLRILQAIVYRGTDPTGPAYAVAVKQLYASHYFETALDLTVCVRDPQRSGMYLIRQNPLLAQSQAG